MSSRFKIINLETLRPRENKKIPTPTIDMIRGISILESIEDSDDKEIDAG